VSTLFGSPLIETKRMLVWGQEEIGQTVVSQDDKSTGGGVPWARVWMEGSGSCRLEHAEMGRLLNNGPIEVQKVLHEIRKHNDPKVNLRLDLLPLLGRPSV